LILRASRRTFDNSFRVIRTGVTTPPPPVDRIESDEDMNQTKYEQARRFIEQKMQSAN
jgi:hypothetical protein